MIDRDALLRECLAGLRSYGSHPSSCACMTILLSDPPLRQPCNCGLAELIARIKAAISAPQPTLEQMTLEQMREINQEQARVLRQIMLDCADHPLYLGDDATEADMIHYGGDAASVTNWHHIARTALEHY